MSDEGGDAVCWAHLVCPACGRLTGPEAPDPVEGRERCEQCGRELP